MVEPQPSKLVARVRFPSPAPNKTPFWVFSFSLSFGNLCSNLVAFALRLNSLFLTESRLRFFVHWTRLTPFPSPAPSENCRAYGSIFCFTKNAALYCSQFSLYRPNTKANFVVDNLIYNYLT